MNVTGVIWTSDLKELPRGGELEIIVEGYSFKGVDMERAMITALVLDSLVEAVVHLVFL